MDKKDPYEYILMRRPAYDFQAENETKPEDQQLGEDKLEELWREKGEEIPHDIASSTKPDHKWVIMRGAYIKFADAMRERGYRSPDAFDMYIYNDFEGYGCLEMVENHVRRSSRLVNLRVDSLTRLTELSVRYKHLRRSTRRRTMTSKICGTRWLHWLTFCLWVTCFL